MVPLTDIAYHQLAILGHVSAGLLASNPCMHASLCSSMLYDKNRSKEMVYLMDMCCNELTSPCMIAITHVCTREGPSLCHQHEQGLPSLSSVQRR